MAIIPVAYAHTELAATFEAPQFKEVINMGNIIEILTSGEFWLLLATCWKGANMIIVGILEWKDIPQLETFWTKVSRIAKAVLGLKNILKKN